MENLTWREAAAVDALLLHSLFTADKAAEFAPLGLAPQQLETLLTLQFRARQLAYSQNYPAAVDMILCAADGTSVGRHLVERQPSSYRGIDLSVLPGFRGQGIGTWALLQIQQLAELEGVPFRLSVLRSNTSALKLYERLGFLKTAGNEVSFEMEWQPSQTGALRKSRSAIIEESIPLDDGSGLPRQQVLDRIAAFLHEIGLTVQFSPVASNSFLPGIQMVSGGLHVDTTALLYPGDLLHEAGHLAVMTPDRRSAEFPSSTDAAEEMAVLAWSYAAATHLGLPPEVVFHQHGYKGQAHSLIQGFQQGNPIGLPFLWWIGLTTQALPEQPSIFPRMSRWLREAPPAALSASHLPSRTETYA